MSEPEPAACQFIPMYEGLPVLVRLITNEDVLCVAYRPADPDDQRILIERPLVRRQTHVERWMSLSAANIFPLYFDHVLSIGPLTPDLMNVYISGADIIYQQRGGLLDEQPAEESAPPLKVKAAAEAVVNSYFDYVLQNFQPKGRPN